MRKKISLILYTLFFGFSLSLIVSCVLLMIECLGNNAEEQGLEAVSIDPVDSGPSSYEKVDGRITLTAIDTVEPDCDYAYNMLRDENEKYLYHKLDRNLYCIDKSKNEQGCYKTEYIVVSGVEMPEASVKHALDAFLTDHPEIFWINNTFGYAYNEGSTVVECYSQLSATECEIYIERISQKMDKLLEGVDSATDDYQKEKLLHDRLLNCCSYAEGVKSISDGWRYFTSYGAIVDGSAVCEGYAKAFQMLLAKSGISAYTVKGYADDVRHMWNIAELDGNWYHVDPTWDDGTDEINYEFFNLSEYEIEKRHSVDPMDGDSEQTNVNFFLPECNSMELNYYNVDGIVIDRFDNDTDNEIVQYIVDRVNDNSKYLYVTICDGIDYEDCKENLFNAPNHRIYHYIEAANEFLDSSHKVDHTGISLLEDEERRTIRIKLNMLQ